MSDMILTQGTVGTRFTFTVRSGEYVIDLTNFDVYVRFRNLTSSTALFERACTKLEPITSGVAYYTWQSGDLDDTGMYELEVMIVSTDDTISVTSKNKQRIRVTPSIALT